jgi:hypothetical protein
MATHRVSLGCGPVHALVSLADVELGALCTYLYLEEVLRRAVQLLERLRPRIW